MPLLPSAVLSSQCCSCSYSDGLVVRFSNYSCPAWMLYECCCCHCHLGSYVTWQTSVYLLPFAPADSAGAVCMASAIATVTSYATVGIIVAFLLLLASSRFPGLSVANASGTLTLNMTLVDNVAIIHSCLSCASRPLSQHS